jgi:hypothetical protein
MTTRPVPKWRACLPNKCRGSSTRNGENLEVLSSSIDKEVHKYKKAINEQDVSPVHIARVVAQCAGMVRLHRGKFVVPKKRVALLASARAGELFRDLE